MRISKKTQYGLRAMAYLAKFFSEKKIIALRTISKEEEIPFDFLGKIISELEKAGLVKAKKGVRGGCFLSVPPKAITAKKIMDILEDTNILVNCRACPRIKKCLTKDVWEKIEKSLNQTLNSITLEDLAK